MSTYSVVIRTLGKSPQLESELRNICSLSVKPQTVNIYIPEGYKRPDFQIASEQYFFVEKGMAAQRLLPYDNVKSDYILMLDDDVSLSPKSVETLIEAMEEYDADLVGADTYKNHKMPFKTKLFVALSNLVFPHWNQKWAFKIHRNGSFSYLNKPKNSFYWAQSCGGNAMLWRMEAYKKLHMEDELWLDNLTFSHGDDMVESYKAHVNDMKLGVVYDSGISHLDSKTASSAYHQSPDKVYTRTMAQFAVWWRTCYKPGADNFFSRCAAAFAFLLKMIWMFFMFLSLSVGKLKFSYISNFVKGLKAGWNFVHSENFTSLRPYVVKK